MLSICPGQTTVICYVLILAVHCNLFGMDACWTIGICLVSILDGLLEYPLCLFLLDYWTFFRMHSCLTTVTLLSILECLVEFPVFILAGPLGIILCLFLLDYCNLFSIYTCWTTVILLSIEWSTVISFVFILAGLLEIILCLFLLDC